MTEIAEHDPVKDRPPRVVVAASGAHGAVPASGPQNGPAALEEMPEVEPAAVALGNAEQAVRLRAIPFGFDNGRLLLAMLDPADLAAADEMSVTTGRPVTRLGATTEVF